MREQIHPPVAIIFPQSLPSTTRWEALVTISYIIGNWDGSLVRYHQIHRTFPNTFTLLPSNSGTSLLVFGKNRGLRPQNPPCLLGIAMRQVFLVKQCLFAFCSSLLLPSCLQCMSHSGCHTELHISEPEKEGRQVIFAARSVRVEVGRSK